jgi:hypothetical protein
MTAISTGVDRLVAHAKLEVDNARLELVRAERCLAQPCSQLWSDTPAQKLAYFQKKQRQRQRRVDKAKTDLYAAERYLSSLERRR